MWGLYKESVDCHPPPSRVSLATMTPEREELYWNVPSLGEPIPAEDPPLPFSADDSTLEDEETTRAVHRLILNRLGGPSGIRAEHLFQCLIATTRVYSPDATNWLKAVAIVQAAFQDGTLAKECTCKIVILITKRKGYLRGIGIVKVLWKATVRLLNRCLMAAISFHDTLHMF